MYEMYTDEGNSAVARALASITLLSEDHTKVWNKETLTQVAVPIIEGVAKNYPEVYDTEPRNYIADALDLICKMNGWSHNEWEGYDY